MVTIRGWLKQGFDPKKNQNCRHIPESGSGRERMAEQNHLFGLSLYYEGVAGRWYFDLRNNSRFEACEQTAALVEEWSLEDYYPNPGVGLTPIIYALDGRPGAARLIPATNGGNAELKVAKCPTIADLEALYLAVRRGEAKVVEVWDGASKRLDPRDEQIAQMQRELDQFRRTCTNLSVAMRWVGALVNVNAWTRRGFERKLRDVLVAHSVLWDAIPENYRREILDRYPNKPSNTGDETLVA